jgi:hypothetical protein
MDVEPGGFGGERRQQTDRALPRYQQGPRFPETPPANEHHLLQGFGNHGGRFQEHAEQAQVGIHFDRVFGFDAPALRHEAVNVFDPALGVLPVAAHVPFPHRAGRTGNRIRTPDDARHQVTFFKRTAGTWINDAPQRFMAQHQTCGSLRRSAIFSFHDLYVDPTDSNGDRFHQD